MFSAVILTLNEEKNLPGCLQSLEGCDDIVVLDSGSTDRTSQIATSAGARVFVNPFRDFAQQRNFAHASIPFRHPWVFHLDADEQLTPSLFAECHTRSAENPAHLDGWFAAPHMLFRGRWIPHCTDFPAYQARFCHAQRFRFVQAGHGQREAPAMRMGRLRSSYLHNLSSESETDLEAKHARYARHEAHAFVNRPASAPLLRRLRSPDPLLRRRALKELSHHLPARGLLRFLYQYGWRRGFLDGRPGLAYCLLLSRYERAVASEIRRLRTSR